MRLVGALLGLVGFLTPSTATISSMNPRESSGAAARKPSSSLERSKDLRCYWIYYYDEFWDIEYQEYECFDVVDVPGDVIYVSPNDWWGPPGPLWPEYPPSLPEPVQGLPPADVYITEADITNNVVRVNLTGSGPLRLETSRHDDQRTVLFLGQIGSGSHTFSFNADSLPPGQYKDVLAWWIDGLVHVRSVDFTVRGHWTHTQYATIHESTCSGDPREGILLGAEQPFCSWYTTWFQGRFVPETWENGSGISVGYGALQLPWGSCYNSLGGDNRFKQVSQIEGACNRPVTDNTVAQGSATNTQPAHCGKWIYIVGIGMKQVTDRCPACWHGGAEGHLDNYTSAVLANCSRGTASLGTYQTIFMPW